VRAAAPVRRRSSTCRSADLKATAQDGDPAGFASCCTNWQGRQRARRAHRHRVARRHGVDQSRAAWSIAVGLFAKSWRTTTCSGREDSLGLTLGVFAQGPASRARHRRDELFIMLSALGLSHQINGARLLPVGTLYDPFIERGLRCDELCLLPRCSLHGGGDAVRGRGAEARANLRSRQPLIGIGQDGLASIRAVFVDELFAVIMGWGFDPHAARGMGSALGAVAADMTPVSVSRDITGRLLAAQAGRRTATSWSAYNRRRSHTGRSRPSADRREPSRRSVCCDHLGRPALCGMVRRAEFAPRPPRCAAFDS